MISREVSLKESIDKALALEIQMKDLEVSLEEILDGGTEILKRPSGAARHWLASCRARWTRRTLFTAVP